MKTSLFLIAAVSLQIASGEYYGVRGDRDLMSVSTKAEKEASESSKPGKVWVCSERWWTTMMTEIIICA